MTMKMTMAEFVGLEPCPFCGGEAKPYNLGEKHLIECDDCKEYGHGAYVVARTEAEAIAAWNSRAERTCERILYKPTGVLVCSECGAGMPKQLDKYCYLHYCPNCGCKVVK